MKRYVNAVTRMQMDETMNSFFPPYGLKVVDYTLPIQVVNDQGSSFLVTSQIDGVKKRMKIS